MIDTFPIKLENAYGKWCMFFKYLYHRSIQKVGRGNWLDSLLWLVLFRVMGSSGVGEALIYLMCRREVTHLAKAAHPSTRFMSTQIHRANSEGGPVH